MDISKITDIERKIMELSPAIFQRFCDIILYKMGYKSIASLGIEAGTEKTTIGNPDSFSRKENKKYTFVAYTTQQNNIYNKLKEDIEKCLDKYITGVSSDYIDEIICCHTSSNLNAGDEKNLHDLCSRYGITLIIFGVNRLANIVFNDFPQLSKDFLGLSIDTQQILDLDDFIKLHDENKMSAPLETSFLYREEEKKQIIDLLNVENVVILTGKAGVGKTRLGLEVANAFANGNDYNLLCVRNNRLELYEDLVSATEQSGKYLFFIDDGNDFNNLSHIFEYINRDQYTVKIIITVRDYAKEYLIQEVKKFTSPKIIYIEEFSDQGIEEFLNYVLGIKNRNYIKKIISIAEGNPRIAYMAGKVALDKQSLSSIKDVSEIYDLYYSEFASNLMGGNKNLCIVAGILSILKSIKLDDLSDIKDLLNYFSISDAEFMSNINKLYEYEVVEIYYERLAVFSDQCLLNYLLYYIFIYNKRIISLSEVLEFGFRHFSSDLVSSINTILNIYQSETTTEICKEEISKVWDNFYKENNPCYEEYVKAFHILRPEKSFDIAKKKINKINPVNFNIDNLDFCKNNYGQDNLILSLLAGYRNSDELKYVLKLFDEYSGKTKDTMKCSFDWLERNYGLKVEDYYYNFYTQIKISEYLLNRISGEDEHIKLIALNWAKYSLGLFFDLNEVGRNNTILIYNLKLSYSESTMKYRGLCWNILEEFSDEDKWSNDILNFLEVYSNNLLKDYDSYVVNQDLKHIDNILIKLKSNSLGFKIIVKKFICRTREINDIFLTRWSEMLTGTEWELYNILEYSPVDSDLGYIEYYNNWKSKIIDYGKNIKKSEINSLVKNIENILDTNIIKEDIYYFNLGLELMVQNFDYEEMYEFFVSFINYATSISINPFYVFNTINTSNNYKEIFNSLKASDFPQKYDWLIAFFQTLPEKEVNFSMVNELLNFFRESNYQTYSTKFIDLTFLDKFKKVEPDIYAIISSIIFAYKEENKDKAALYFRCFFIGDLFSARELLEHFKNNLELLNDIYFFMIENYGETDILGNYLIEFLSNDDAFINRYAEELWKGSVRFDNNRNKALWKSNGYIKHLDSILYSSEPYRWESLAFYLEFPKIFEDSNLDAEIKMRQEKWVEHIIKENSNTEWIYPIFDFLSELDNNLRSIGIKTFIENNKDYQIFERLSLTPKFYSSFGGFSKLYQKEIDFLESILKDFYGVELLEHNIRIGQLIKYFKDKIENEKLEDIIDQQKKRR